MTAPTSRSPSLSPSLEPVRAELLRQARAEAEAAVAQAEAEAARQVADARAEAAAILDEARARGRADADTALRAAVARARRQARTVGLRARREVYESWRAAIFDGVRDLRRSPEYPQVMSCLGARARDLLGAGVRIEDDAAGGLRAAAPGRVMDLTLETIAARAVADAEAEASRLWTS
jgi:vacuolar-type H+-ATPase subunit E/Vma4